MKRIIFFSLAALAAAVFAIPDAQGIDGQTLNVHLAGSNFITSDEDGRPTPLNPPQVLTALQSGIAKGGGSALFSSQTVLEQAGPDPRCTPLVGADLGLTIVLTYADGSILSIVEDPDNPQNTFYCTDGTIFFVELSGIITGGDGRFEGASGLVTGTASSLNSRVKADLSIDLD